MPEGRLQRTREFYQQGFTCTAFEGPPMAGGLADLIVAPDVMAAMTTAAAGMFNPPPDVAEKMQRLRREVYDELAASTRGAYQRVLTAESLTPDLDADVALVMRDLATRMDAGPHQHLWRRQDATEAEYGRAECVVCGQTSTCKEAFDV